MNKTTQHLIWIILPAALIISIIIIIFFLGLFQKPSQKSGGAKVNINLTEGFPSIPIYPDAVLTSSDKDPREKILFNATWETGDEVSKVAQWYIDMLQKEGWLLEIPPGDINNADVQFAQFSNDTYTLNISIIREASGKTVIVTEHLNNMKTEQIKNQDPAGNLPK